MSFSIRVERPGASLDQLADVLRFEPLQETLATNLSLKELQVPCCLPSLPLITAGVHTDASLQGLRQVCSAVRDAVDALPNHVWLAAGGRRRSCGTALTDAADVSCALQQTSACHQPTPLYAPQTCKPTCAGRAGWCAA